MAVTLAILLACWAPIAYADEVPTERLRMEVKGELSVSVPGLVTVIVIDPTVVAMKRTAGGFSLVAKRSGDTVIQAFTATGMKIFIVAIGMPTPKIASATSSEATLSDFGHHRSKGKKTLFDLNRYDGEIWIRKGHEVESSHELTTSGKLGDGTHETSLHWTARGDDLRIDSVLGKWQDKDKQKLVTVGHVSAPVAGASFVTGLPVLGSYARFDSGPVYTELSAGSIAGGSGKFDLTQPMIGFGVGHHYQDSERKERQIVTHATSYAYRHQSGAGYLSGIESKAYVNKQVAVDGKAAVSYAATPEHGLAPQFAAAIAASHTTDRDMFSANAEAEQKGFFNPATGFSLPGRLLFGGMYTRRFTEGLTSSFGATHQFLQKESGIDQVISSLVTQISAKLSSDQRVSLSERESFSPDRSKEPDTIQELRRQRVITGEYVNRLSATSQLTGNFDYRMNRFTDREQQMFSVSAGMGKMRGDAWSGQATVGTNLQKTQVLGEEQEPLAIQNSVAANGQFIDGPLEFSGSISINQMVAPTSSVGYLITTGVQFTPTTAHRIGATMIGRQTFGREDFTWTFNLGYTQYFGNAVNSRPLIRSKMQGDIEGIVCVDENADGECGPKEVPLSGVKVTLSSGERAVTDKAGRYKFSDVKPGEHMVEVDEGALRKYGRLTSGSLAPVVLENKQSAKVNFGVSSGCELAGSVFNDLDMDGARGAGDPLMGNIGIRLQGPDGVVETRTDGLGGFSVHVKKCGDYTASILSGSLPQSTDVLKGEEILHTEKPGDRAMAKLGVYTIRAMQGIVFHDKNGNGVLDQGEAPVAKAVLSWGQNEGESDTDGSYLLRRLPAQAITVQVKPESLPANLKPGKPVSVEIGREADIAEINIPVVSK